VATFTQLVQPDAPFWLNFAYGFWMSFAHWVWFSIVALVFSNKRLRAAMLARQRLLDKVIGVALLGLGASLLFANSVSPGDLAGGGRRDGLCQLGVRRGPCWIGRGEKRRCEWPDYSSFNEFFIS